MATQPVEPHLRLVDVARLRKTSKKLAWQLFKGRPGVVVLKSPRTGKRVVLIPESVYNEQIWDGKEMARVFRLPLEFVTDIFKAEPGVWFAGTDIEIPESVRQRVFKKAALD